MPDQSHLGPGAALSTAQLAREVGTTPEYITRLVESGAIAADGEGRFGADTVPQVRLTIALADGGIDLDDLMAVIRSGPLRLDWVGRLWTVGEPTGRTFDEFARSLGDRADLLPAIYAALGLAPPMPDTGMRQDEERVLTDFIELWSLVDDRPEVYLRAARIAGDGVRRIQGATQDLFDELGGPPGFQLARGKSPAESMRPALRLGPGHRGAAGLAAGPPSGARGVRPDRCLRRGDADRSGARRTSRRATGDRLRRSQRVHGADGNGRR
jgi:hypothetical protein